MNGKYFLVKMYTAEAVEHFQQAYSLTTLYVCMMPVEISLIVCATLSIELAINIWSTFHMRSQDTRDMLLMLDIFTDLFCLVFPLCYTRFVLKIPILMESMLLIVVYPTVSLLSKLYEIWEDYFRIDEQRINKMEGLSAYRRRSSIFGLLENRKAVELQLKHYPKRLRYTFATLNASFLLFFAIMADAIFIATIE